MSSDLTENERSKVKEALRSSKYREQAECEIRKALPGCFVVVHWHKSAQKRSAFVHRGPEDRGVGIFLY